MMCNFIWCATRQVAHQISKLGCILNWCVTPPCYVSLGLLSVFLMVKYLHLLPNIRIGSLMTQQSIYIASGRCLIYGPFPALPPLLLGQASWHLSITNHSLVPTKRPPALPVSINLYCYKVTIHS